MPGSISPVARTDTGPSRVTSAGMVASGARCGAGAASTGGADISAPVMSSAASNRPATATCCCAGMS